MSIDPRDYEMDEEEMERLAKEFDRMAAKYGKKRPPLPKDLSKLLLEILGMSAVRMGVPDAEPYMFERFEAFNTKVGGMGMVLEARDPQLDRKVAIKLWLATGAAAEWALLAEAKKLAKLSHPNVVTVHETGKWRDRVYFVMEWVDGGNVREWLRKEPRSWEQVHEVFVGAGEGLAAVHDAGILHQDFKPANLLITESGRALVADFGVADMLHSMLSKLLGQPNGTLAYMAPERLRGERGDARSDQFSFCVSLWEALHGVRPFRGKTREELLDAIQSDLIQGDPRDERVPLWLSRVAAKGLSPDPDGRFDDMHELIEALIGDPPISEQVDGETAAGNSKSSKQRLLNRPAVTRQDSPGPARRRWPWVAAAGFSFGVALALAMVMAVPSAEAGECEEVMSELDPVWNNEVRAELRGAFGTRKAGDALMDWTSRWLTVRAQECDAAKLEARATKPSPCTVSTRERLEATLHAFRTPHLREGLEVATVIAELPAPEYCLEHPEDGEWGNGGLLELRNIDVEVEALVRMGDLEVAWARHADYLKLVQELHSDYGFARVAFWNAEIHRLEGELEQAAWIFERVYEDAQELEVPVFGAEVLMKLTAVAGAQGKAEVANARAHAARAVFAVRRPARVAELLEVQGLALVSGPERWRAQGVALLLRAVELREAQLQEYKGTRELLSQAHESYARGLLAVHRASEALEYLDLALSVHQDEFGHGTWRTRGILRQKFLALVELKRFDTAEPVWREVLKLDANKENWRRYAEDALWVANSYKNVGENRRAAIVVHAGRARAVEHELADEVTRFDLALSELVME